MVDLVNRIMKLILPKLQRGSSQDGKLVASQELCSTELVIYIILLLK